MALQALTERPTNQPPAPPPAPRVVRVHLSPPIEVVDFTREGLQPVAAYLARWEAQLREQGQEPVEPIDVLALNAGGDVIATEKSEYVRRAAPPSIARERGRPGEGIAIAKVRHFVTECRVRVRPFIRATQVPAGRAELIAHHRKMADLHARIADAMAAEDAAPAGT